MQKIIKNHIKIFALLSFLKSKVFDLVYFGLGKKYRLSYKWNFRMVGLL